MKLRPAINVGPGPSGIWLIDESDKDRFLITVTPCDGKLANKLAMQLIAATISESLPEIIEVPDV